MISINISISIISIIIIIIIVIIIIIIIIIIISSSSSPSCIKGQWGWGWSVCTYDILQHLRHISALLLPVVREVEHGHVDDLIPDCEAGVENDTLILVGPIVIC